MISPFKRYGNECIIVAAVATGCHHMRGGVKYAPFIRARAGHVRTWCLPVKSTQSALFAADICTYNGDLSAAKSQIFP